jgi:hypothetical protein
VNDRSTAVAYQPASVIDSHLDVVVYGIVALPAEVSPVVYEIEQPVEL